MKLIGSMTEDYFRENLSSSWEGIKKNAHGIYDFLQKLYGPLNSAFLLFWTPDQDEDLLVMLINGKIVSTIIYLREDNIFREEEVVFVETYIKKKSKVNRIQILVALDLAGKLEKI